MVQLNRSEFLKNKEVKTNYYQLGIANFNSKLNLSTNSFFWCTHESHIQYTYKLNFIIFLRILSNLFSKEIHFLKSFFRR